MADKTKGFSLAPSAQVASTGIGMGSGRAKAVRHKWGTLRYTGKAEGKKATALFVTFERGGETKVEAFTCGKGFKASSDGLSVVPAEGGTPGLNRSSKAGLYLASLASHAQMPDDFDLDPITNLDGCDLELIKKPMEKGDGMTGDPTVLLADDVYAAPWKIKGGGKKKKDEDETDDDKDDETDDDKDDEKPAKKGKKTDRDDDGDDDKAAPEDDDEDLDEVAGEALIAALEDGPLKASQIESAVLAQVKKQKNGKAIAARAAEPKFLKTEKGWSRDGKKATLD